MRQQLQSFSIDSRTVPAHERFELIRAAAGQTFEISRPDSAQSTADFRFEGIWWRCDRIIVAKLHYDDFTLTRSRRNLSSDHVDHYRLVMLRHGSIQSDSDGYLQVLKPADVLFNDMARPAAHRHDAGASLSVYVPREMLDEALPKVIDLHGLTPQGVAASLLSCHLQTLSDAIPYLSPAEAPGVRLATISMLAACLQPSSSTLEKARPALESTLVRQMCRYIDLHICESDLSAARITEFFNVSRSALYRLFGPFGGVANFIRERRLARVHAALASSQGRVLIGRVAKQHGFRSVAQFNRSFKAHYGYSPQDLRQGNFTSADTSATPSQIKGATQFDIWIRSLRD